MTVVVLEIVRLPTKAEPLALVSWALLVVGSVPSVV